MLKLYYTIIFLTLIISLSGCLYDKGEIAQPANGCDTSYYTLNIKPIIETNCAKSGCHVPGGAAPADFTTYANLKPFAIDTNDIYTRINLPANDGMRMPKQPNAPLDSTNKALLNDWIINRNAMGCD